MTIKFSATSLDLQRYIDSVEGLVVKVRGIGGSDRTEVNQMMIAGFWGGHGQETHLAAAREGGGTSFDTKM